MSPRNRLVLNLLVMFALSLASVYLTRGIAHGGKVDTAIPTTFLLGRALTSTVFPLVIAAVSARIYKYINKTSMPGFIVMLWLLWVLLSIAALFGDMITKIGKHYT